MNIYFTGMCIAMAIYLIVGVVVSKKVKTANDFYVAGRQAPVILIAGSLIASYTSTGMFMGDAAQCYEGLHFHTYICRNAVGRLYNRRNFLRQVFEKKRCAYDSGIFR